MQIAVSCRPLAAFSCLQNTGEIAYFSRCPSDNRWIKLAELIPWDELEDDYASHFCKGFGAPAKPFRMALGALTIKARMAITDEELVEQLKENPYLRVPRGIDSS